MRARQNGKEKERDGIEELVVDMKCGSGK